MNITVFPGKNDFCIIWHLGGFGMGQNTPRGCGNDLPILLRNNIFAKIEKCKLYFLSSSFGFLRCLDCWKNIYIYRWQSASLVKSRNFEKMDYVQFWKNVPISDYFGSLFPIILEKHCAFSNYFWKNVPFSKIVGNIQSFFKLFWTKTDRFAK